MEQFDLQEYLDNPNRKVVTRKGDGVRIICTNRICTYLDEDYPVVGLVRNRFDGSEMVAGFKSNGKSKDKNWDLFFIPKKKEKWVNVYGSPDGRNWLGENLYNTEKAAKADTSESRVATVKIEWEE